MFKNKFRIWIFEFLIFWAFGDNERLERIVEDEDTCDGWLWIYRE